VLAQAKVDLPGVENFPASHNFEASELARLLVDLGVVDVLVVPVDVLGKALLWESLNSGCSFAVLADCEDDLAFGLLDGGDDEL
jgi:hypothetical protein